MFIKFLLTLLVLIFCNFSLSATDVSVIVPCYWGHFQFIEGLLDNLESQTRVPDEVVISLSQANKIANSEIKRIESKIYSFDLNIISSNKIIYAGENRNRAANAAKGEILIAQDADDVPHPQRIEIIETIMMRPGVDHLIHQWLGEMDNIRVKEEPPEWIDFYEELDSIPVLKVSSIDEYRKCQYFHNGHIAITKKLWKKNRWGREKRGQDVRYNFRLISKYKNTHLVYAPLVIYNMQNSSLDKG